MVDAPKITPETTAPDIAPVDRPATPDVKPAQPNSDQTKPVEAAKS